MSPKSIFLCKKKKVIGKKKIQYINSNHIKLLNFASMYKHFISPYVFPSLDLLHVPD